MSKPTIVVPGLTFDPGLSQTGWAAVEWRVTGPDILLKVCRYGEYTLTREINKVRYNEVNDLFGRRIVTLRLLYENLHLLIQQHKPVFIVSEDAFFNPRRPTAYRALMQWLTILDTVAFDYQKKVRRIAPKAVKQAITGYGGSGKASVQDAVLSAEDIVFRQTRKLVNLTSHQGDAIAVAYRFGKESLMNEISSGIPDRACKPEPVSIKEIGGQPK